MVVDVYGVGGTCPIGSNHPEAYVLIAYGGDLFYHYSAIFAALRIGAHKQHRDDTPILIYTDRPQLFHGYPFQIVEITQQQYRDWSFDDRYHFRIKNRVMHDVLGRGFERVLYLDSDVAFTDDPYVDMARIAPRKAIMFKNEGPANTVRGLGYSELLRLPKSLFEGDDLSLSGHEPMWGSAFIGLHRGMRPAVELADRIICGLFGRVNVHTIEQYALSVALARSHDILPCQGRFDIFSKFSRKTFARKRLFAFFHSHHHAPFEVQTEQAKRVNLRPPLGDVFARKMLRRGPGNPEDFSRLEASTV